MVGFVTLEFYNSAYRIEGGGDRIITKWRVGLEWWLVGPSNDDPICSLLSAAKLLPCWEVLYLDRRVDLCSLVPRAAWAYGWCEVRILHYPALLLFSLSFSACPTSAGFALLVFSLPLSEDDSSMPHVDTVIQFGESLLELGWEGFLSCRGVKKHQDWWKAEVGMGKVMKERKRVSKRILESQEQTRRPCGSLWKWATERPAGTVSQQWGSSVSSALLPDGTAHLLVVTQLSEWEAKLQQWVLSRSLLMRQCSRRSLFLMRKCRVGG